MSTRQLWLAAATSAFLVGPRVACAQADLHRADSLAVHAVATGIIAADNRRDIEAVLALYADGARLLPPNEPPVTGKAALRLRYEALFRDYTPAIEGRIDELVVAGHWAYVRGHNGGWLRRRAGTPDRRLDDVYLMILERQDNSWRITRLLWHSAAPAIR